MTSRGTLVGSFSIRESSKNMHCRTGRCPDGQDPDRDASSSVEILLKRRENTRSNNRREDHTNRTQPDIPGSASIRRV